MQANALAHARIRELEARVLELESECAEHKLAAGRQSAHVRCLEYTLECVRVGWETMAHAPVSYTHLTLPTKRIV